MQAITFYTNKDIHQQVMKSFDHRAELLDVMIYVRPDDKISENELIILRNRLSVNRIFIKDVKVLYIKNERLMILTCQLIKNSINCTSHTRNRDIIQLYDLLNEMYNDSHVNQLVLSHCSVLLYDKYLLNVYQDDPKKEYIDMFNDIIEPLLLQLDNFMDNR